MRPNAMRLVAATMSAVTAVFMIGIYVIFLTELNPSPFFSTQQNLLLAGKIGLGLLIAISVLVITFSVLLCFLSKAKELSKVLFASNLAQLIFFILINIYISDLQVFTEKAFTVNESLPLNMSILALLFLSIILSGIQLGNNEKEVPKTIDTGAALILRRTASISLTALYTFMFVVLSIVWYDSTSPTLPLSTICIMLFELVVSALGVFFAIKNCERQRSRTAIIFQVVLIPLMLMFLIPMLIGFTALSLGTASISIAVTLIVLAITSLVLTILSLTFKVKNKLDEKLAAYTQLLTDGAITETEYQKLVAKCTRTAFSQTAETEASEDKNEK